MVLLSIGNKFNALLSSDSHIKTVKNNVTTYTILHKYLKVWESVRFELIYMNTIFQVTTQNIFCWHEQKQGN